MTGPLSPIKNYISSSAVYKASSDLSTPGFTPSETPPQIFSSGLSELSDSEKLGSSKMDDAKGEGSKAKDGGEAPVIDNTTTQDKTKTQEAGDSKTKKVSCRKHSKTPAKPKKRSKAKAEASSSDSSSSSGDSSGSSESEDSTDSESSSEEDAQAAKKRKAKAKKAKKLKEKRKAKSRKGKEPIEEEDESGSSDDSSSEEEDKRKKSKSRKKRRSKKSKKEAEESESEEDPSDPLAIAKAQLNALKLRGSLGRRGRGGRLQLDDRLLKKSLSSKAKGKRKKRQVDILRQGIVG